jgi:hypothetical protein
MIILLEPHTNQQYIVCLLLISFPISPFFVNQLIDFSHWLLMMVCNSLSQVALARTFCCPAHQTDRGIHRSRRI